MLNYIVAFLLVFSTAGNFAGAETTSCPPKKVDFTLSKFPANQGMSVAGTYVGDATSVFGTAGVPNAQPKCHYYYPKDFGSVTLFMTKRWNNGGKGDPSCPTGSNVGGTVNLVGGSKVGVDVKLYKETPDPGSLIKKSCFYSVSGGPGSL